MKRSVEHTELDVTFVVVGNSGAVTCCLLKTNLGRLPVDLGYHSRIPAYAGEVYNRECKFLKGEICFSMGCAMQAIHAFEALKGKDEANLWAFLEGYYRRIFETAEGLVK